MKTRQTLTMFAPAAAVALLPVGCARVKVDPIEVKTIHIVHDINIKVDRELDEFFAFQERGRGATTAPATTLPATTTSPTTTPTTTPTVATPGGER